MTKVHHQLFGLDPDKLMFSYRARQYMGLLHSTELVEFVADLDGRITYDILPKDALFDMAFGTSVQKLKTIAELFLLDEVGPPDRGGRTQHSWKVVRKAGTDVEVSRLSPPTEQAITTLTYTEGLSSIFSLLGTDLKARIGQGVIDDTWLVDASVRPTQDIGTIIANLDAIGEDVLLSLFGVGSPKGSTEPFKTFRNLWNNHPEPAYRLGGVLLAWIYQADEILQG